jgi:hypothetical protein
MLVTASTPEGISSCCSIEEVIESGILSRAADTFIACDYVNGEYTHGTNIRHKGGSKIIVERIG